MAIERQPPHVYSATAFRRPQVAVELVLFVVERGRLGVVLVPWEEFGSAPRWGLPAATVEDQDSLESVIEEVARPLLGNEVAKKRQVQTFDRLADSRGRLIEIAYLAATPPRTLDAAPTQYSIGYVGPADGEFALADRDGQRLEISSGHAETIGAAIEELRSLAGDIAFDFLSGEFTLRELHAVHEAILATSLNYDSFRRSVLTSSILEPTGHFEQRVTHRPAELYRVRSRN